MRERVPRVLRAMLDAVIDYAGLFPPASLDLASVAQNYAAYRRGRQAWMLGRLVLPVSRLAAFPEAARPWLPGGEGVVPWRVAALLGEDAAADLASLARFNRADHAGTPRAAVVDIVETRVTSSDEVTALGRAVPQGVRLVCEMPRASGIADILDAVAETGAIAKLRAGGIVSEAFPTTEDLAVFLCETARRRVPIKLTAGLHHAVRGDYRLTYEQASPVGTMHGFLNVLVAATCAFEDRDAPAVHDVLEVTDVASLVLDENGLTWGGARVSREMVERARSGYLVSLGSCAFEEPIEDLRRLGLSL